MLTSPCLDLIKQPDPAGLQLRDGLREVRTVGKAMYLLTAHPE